MQRRVGKDREHPRNQKADEEKDGEGVDNVSDDLAEEKGRWLAQVTVKTDSIAMIQSGSNAEKVRD